MFSISRIRGPVSVQFLAASRGWSLSCPSRRTHSLASNLAVTKIEKIILDSIKVIHVSRIIQSHELTIVFTKGNWPNVVRDVYATMPRASD
jgi:hypothetical protein